MSGAEADQTTLEGGFDAYRGGNVIACAAVFIVLCTVFLVLRCISHHLDSRPYQLEDWIMIPAWIMMMGLSVNVILSMPADNFFSQFLVLIELGSCKAWWSW
jgi:hypothetical protein